MGETRKVEQYKVYTLHENVEIVRGKDKGKEVTRTDRVAVAIFDDAKALAKFQKENKAHLKGFVGYEVVEDWVEYKPEAARFAVAFNPAPADTDNGTD